MRNEEAIAYLHFDTQTGTSPRWCVVLIASKLAAQRRIEAFAVTLNDTLFTEATQFKAWRSGRAPLIGVIEKNSTESLYEAVQRIIINSQCRGVLFHCLASNSLKSFFVFEKQPSLKKLQVHSIAKLSDDDCRAAGAYPSNGTKVERGRVVARFMAEAAQSVPADRFYLPKREDPFLYLWERDEEFRDAYRFQFHYLIARHKLHELTQDEKESRATLEILAQGIKNKYAQEPTYADSFRMRLDGDEPAASSGVAEEFFIAITRSGKNAGFGFTCKSCGLHIPAEAPTTINHCGKTSTVDPTAQMRKVQIGSTAKAGAPMAVPLRDDDGEIVEYEVADPGGI